jgi:hypothetical protein
MRARSFLASGALFLSLVAMGSAKSWDITVDSATRAGNVVLPRGNYTVKVRNDQSQVFFEEAGSGKTYTVPVKIEATEHKYTNTEVQTKLQGDMQVMKSIDLGGTAETLEFGE